VYGWRTVAFVSAVVFVIGTPFVALAGARDDADRCTLTPRGFPVRFTSVTATWEWWPPGTVCVWRSPQGEEMRRRPDEISPWRDRGEGGEKLR